MVLNLVVRIIHLNVVALILTLLHIDSENICLKYFLLLLDLFSENCKYGTVVKWTVYSYLNT